jgi:predicted Fe-S protein YdhL (DUF1289 family)
MKADSIPVEDETIASPCIDVCRMNAASGYCEGCYRSIDEIAHWSVYSAAEKRAVLDRLPARRKPG